MRYDLLIKGGTLVDPAEGLSDVRDVAFAGGLVAAVGEDLDTGDAREVIDAVGCVVTPGLIDIHVHVFAGVSHFGIEPDPTCLARGCDDCGRCGICGCRYFSGVSEVRDRCERDADFGTDEYFVTGYADCRDWRV